MMLLKIVNKIKYDTSKAISFLKSLIFKGYNLATMIYSLRYVIFAKDIYIYIRDQSYKQAAGKTSGSN